MKNRFLKVILISVSIVLVGCAYAFFNSRYGFSIPCLFNKITGLQCPGCGVTRMCISLLNFDFRSAFKYNPVIFCFIPAGLYLLFIGIFRYIRYGVNHFSKSENNLMIFMIAVFIIFGVIRNFI